LDGPDKAHDKLAGSEFRWPTLAEVAVGEIMLIGSIMSTSL
jgi:hypothetical protein